LNNRDGNYFKGECMKRVKAQKVYLVCMVIMSVFVSILSGCGGGGGGSWKEPVSIVSSTVPPNAANVVPIGNKLTVTFSEAMDPATIITTTFTVKQGATPVSGTVSYSGVTAVFTPGSNLAANTVYTATITTGTKTLGGKALSSDYVWNFTTGTTADTTLPTVSSTVPANAATGVANNSAITATFSEPMDPATITAAGTFTVVRGATTVPGTVTYSGVTAVFTPTSVPLTVGAYTATITTAAKDLGGNALAVNKVWSFSVGAVADTTPPTVLSTIPVNADTNVATSSSVSATFSEAMAPFTITTTTFTLKQGVTDVPGTVNFSGVTAVFTPTTTPLALGPYTATITVGAKDLAGNALAVNKVWNFTVIAAVPPLANPTAPVLGEAGRFVILASQAVTTTGGTVISNGDIGLIDIQRSGIAGFTATGPAGDYTQLTNGTSYAFDDANPAPFPNPLHFATPVVGAPWTTTGAMITQVRTDLGIANTFLSAATNPGAPTQVCPTELGGRVLNRGVYLTASNVSITTGPLHLDAQGDPNAVFIFTTDGTLTTGALGSIILDNGALAKNVYWRSAGITTIAASTIFKGNVFAATQVNVLDNAIITGRLFAVTGQVTLINDNVTKAP
jgi:hypothetical protein